MIELPKLPTVKELVPFLFAFIVGLSGAMWSRLGDRDESCDKRVEAALKIAGKVWQDKYDQQEGTIKRQEARIDSAYVKIENITTKQAQTYQQYFEVLAKLKKR